jgi:DNA replication protein DnaC
MVTIEMHYNIMLQYLPYKPNAAQQIRAIAIISNLLGMEYTIPNYKGKNGLENRLINPNKGISLIGARGVGKTTLLKAITQHFSTAPKPLRFITAQDIVSKVSKRGLEALTNYCYGHLCISDIGAELNPVQYYGNTINVIQELILLRYDKQQNLAPADRTKLYLEGNLNSEAIATAYDDQYGRISSRLLELVQTISFGNETHDNRNG